MDAPDYTIIQPSTPGADWYIDGRRYEEASRTPTPDGFTIELKPSNRL
ncbi:hypothetical protein [Nocardia rhizosphaerae]|uniref:Uncharacterized protein n=1 Tax=Nocardia rhizosphaerae TaxID=1691571 RepID=A0ABV8L3S0_9NOCA